MNYRCLNKATRKDHFLLPFVDKILDRLVGKEYYCFLDGYSCYNQITTVPKDQEKKTFTCLYDTFAFRRVPIRIMQYICYILEVHGDIFLKYD